MTTDAHTIDSPVIRIPWRRHRRLVQHLTATTTPVGSRDRRLPGKARRKARRTT